MALIKFAGPNYEVPPGCRPIRSFDLLSTSEETEKLSVIECVANKLPTASTSRARSHPGSEGHGPTVETVREEVGVSISRAESKGLKRLVELIASIRGYESGVD
jgi:hypothetical protein